MTDDIAERLRQRAGNERNLRWGGPEELMVIEAAAEIERLEAALETCRELRTYDRKRGEEIEKLRQIHEMDQRELTWLREELIKLSKTKGIK